MNITKKIKTTLSKLGVRGTERAVWLEMATEELEPDGYFYMDQKDYADKLGFKDTRQLRTHLSRLEKRYLIQRDYRPLETGNRLFIRPLKPETDDCMTFFATLHKCELLDQVEPVIQLHFQDVYNRSGTVRFKECTSFLRGIPMKRLEWLLPGKHICFSASLKVSKQSKEILHVSNIRPSGEYYHA